MRQRQHNIHIQTQYKEFQSKPLKQKGQQLKKILTKHKQITTNYNKLLICLQCLYKYIFNKQLSKQLISLIENNLPFYLTNANDKNIIHMTQKLSTQIIQKCNQPGFKKKMSGLEITSKGSVSSQADSLSTYKRSFSNMRSLKSEDNTFADNFLTAKQYLENLEEFKKIIRNKDEQIQGLKQDNQCMKQKCSKLDIMENKLKKYEQKIESVSCTLAPLLQQLKSLRQQMERLSNTISKQKIKHDDTLCRIKNDFQNIVWNINQKQNTNKNDILLQMCNRISNINWKQCIKTNIKQQSIEVEATKNKIKQCMQDYQNYLTSILMKNSNQFTDGKCNSFKDVLQQYVKQSISNKEQISRLMGMWKQLQRDKDKKSKMSSREKIVQEPTLCFMWSSVLPILNTHDKQMLEQSKKTQQNVISMIQSYYKKTKKVLFLKQHYSKTQYKHISQDPHPIIDDIPHLLLIIRLQNNTIIGAYSQSGITKSNPSNNNIGFLFQCTNNRVYTLRQKFKTNSIMPYNDYYIIVGNHDIKVKYDEWEVESCFGKENSMFRPNSEYKVEGLLGKGLNGDVVGILDLEFFQVYFK